jgi:hypothetical protein
MAASSARIYLHLERLVPTDNPPGWISALAGDAERKKNDELG